MSELLPCPFCGYYDVRLTLTKNNGETAWRTSHTGCEAEVLFYGDNQETKNAVIETWNKRADKDAKEDINFLLKLVPEWAKTNEKNLCPTMYGTGTYEGDASVAISVEAIKNKYKGEL